jgi:hypothetical protein
MVEFIKTNKMVEIFINSEGLTDVRKSDMRPPTKEEIEENEIYWKTMELPPVFRTVEHTILKKLAYPPRTLMEKIIDDYDWD